MYRLAADVFNDAAMILDCLSPAFPKGYRVALLSLSSVLRSLCGVAAGSSKASLSAHFATQGNLGELNAVCNIALLCFASANFWQKDSSQETIISLMGMLAGSLVVSHISSMWATWTALIFLLGVHLGTNYLAVRAVCMRTLNRQRANLVYSSLLEQIAINKHTTHHQSESADSILPRDLKYPTPEEVRVQERIFERDGVLRFKGQVLGHCRLGVDLMTVLQCFTQSDRVTGSHAGNGMADFVRLLESFKGYDYILWYNIPRRTFLVVLKEGADAATQLSAWMLALYFAKYGEIEEDESLVDALGRAADFLGRVDGEMLEFLGKMWDVETSALETRSGTRIRMKS